MCKECALPLGTEFPQDELQSYQKNLHQAFQRKISSLRERGIEQILRKNNGDLAKQLIEVLHLADLEKIAHLLSEDKNNQITRLFKKIFNSRA
jgi:hypothetical protein